MLTLPPGNRKRSKKRDMPKSWHIGSSNSRAAHLYSPYQPTGSVPLSKHFKVQFINTFCPLPLQSNLRASVSERVPPLLCCYWLPSSHYYTAIPGKLILL